MKLLQRIVLATVCVLAPCLSFCQNPKMEITGTVTDDDGEPAISIVIRDKTEKGDVYGITDYDGNFKIKADPTTSLHFSGLTYEPKVVKLKGKQHINVVMSFEARQLDEVVVVAKRIINKLAPVPTEIEIVGNQYIIHPKVKIPKEMFKPDSRVIVQPELVNITRGTQNLFRPAVVTGNKYAIMLERMMEFDLSRDPLHPYYEKAQRVEGNEMVAYADSLPLDNPDDECRCDIYMYIVNYRKVTYQDTAVIAKGTINPMRFFDFNIGAKKITDERYLPRPKKQLRGDKGQVNLTFLVNSAKIDDSDPNNAIELNEMRDKLVHVGNDPNAEFMSFSVTAISSPEGSYQSNLKLAWKRAATAKKTILDFLSPATVRAMQDSISVDARVDTWGSVADLMEKDSISAEGVRKAIASYPNSSDIQNRLITHLPNYRSVIVKNYLARLRRVEYSFSYSVMRLLNDQEIRKVYERNYKDLTQYEFWRMFVNAQTEEQQEEICHQALEVYPKFMLMANELAVILIDRKEPDVNLLEPFITERAPQELLCNQIIALFDEKDYVRADSIASMLESGPMTADVKALAGALNGNFQAAYDHFASRGGTNEVVLLLALKRNEEAFKKLDDLPDEALTYYLRAVAANRLDKITDAFDNLKKAIAADPKLKDIARIDGDVTDILQQIEEDAKEKAEQAKEVKDEKPEAAVKKQAKKTKKVNKPETANKSVKKAGKDRKRKGKGRGVTDVLPVGNDGTRIKLNAIPDTTGITPVPIIDEMVPLSLVKADSIATEKTVTNWTEGESNMKNDKERNNNKKENDEDKAN